MELFLQACGRTGPLRLSIEEEGHSLASQRVLHQPFALVGCDPRMDLFLSHPQVARRHAYVQLLGGKLFCIDLQSQSEIVWPPDADQAIRIGPFSIRPTDGDGEDPPSLTEFSTSEPANEEELPEVALEFVNRLPGPTVWRMATTLALVGKASLCRVRLVGNSVSKFHCSLVRTPLGLWVVDLFGKEGITVNETPVRSARLEDGDRLQVGNFIIRPRYLRPPPVRIPFSHPGDVAQQIVEQQGSSISLPPFQETISEMASLLMEAGTPSHAASVAGTSAHGFPVAPPVSQLVPMSGESLPANAELVQSLLVPLAQQLGTIQQHMFEQFQQSMLMMFQMFGKLQREQMGVIRDEMDRLHELSREVLALQTELAKRPQPVGQVSTLPPQVDRPRSAPAAAARAVPNSVATKPDSRSTAAPKPTTESKPLPLPQGQPEKDMHAWLSQRLATLQQEQQSGWQKIVSFLSGKRREKSTP